MVPRNGLGLGLGFNRGGGSDVNYGELPAEFIVPDTLSSYLAITLNKALTINSYDGLKVGLSGNPTGTSANIPANTQTRIYVANSGKLILGQRKDVVGLNIQSSNIKCDITGMPLRYVYFASAPNFSGDIANNQGTLGGMYLEGTMSLITCGSGGNPFGTIATGWGIRYVSPASMSAQSYINLFMYASQSIWTNKEFTIGAGSSPGYATELGGVKAYYDKLVTSTGSGGLGVTVTIPAGWKGGVFPNDFPS